MIVLGLGFRKSADIFALREIFQALGGHQATALATAQDKTTAPVFLAFTTEIGLPVHAISPADLAAQTTLTQSARVQSLYGTGSLAESAALAAAGPNARLLGPRITSKDGTATAALAKRIPE